jgi:hypothetical protein
MKEERSDEERTGDTEMLMERWLMFGTWDSSKERVPT